MAMRSTRSMARPAARTMSRIAQLRSPGSTTARPMAPPRSPDREPGRSSPGVELSISPAICPQRVHRNRPATTHRTRRAARVAARSTWMRARMAQRARPPSAIATPAGSPRVATLRPDPGTANPVAGRAATMTAPDLRTSAYAAARLTSAARRPRVLPAVLRPTITRRAQRPLAARHARGAPAMPLACTVRARAGHRACVVRRARALRARLLRRARALRRARVARPVQVAGRPRDAAARTPRMAPAVRRMPMLLAALRSQPPVARR